jgi:excisionase family DNA binding protein
MHENLRAKLIDLLNAVTRMNEAVIALIVALKEEPPVQADRERLPVVKELLSVNEAAAYTGYTRSYLYKLVALKELPRYKPTGGRVFFKRAELDAFMTHGERQANRVIAATADMIPHAEA